MFPVITFTFDQIFKNVNYSPISFPIEIDIDNARYQLFLNEMLIGCLVWNILMLNEPCKCALRIHHCYYCHTNFRQRLLIISNIASAENRLIWLLLTQLHCTMKKLVFVLDRYGLGNSLLHWNFWTLEWFAIDISEISEQISQCISMNISEEIQILGIKKCSMRFLGISKLSVLKREHQIHLQCAFIEIKVCPKSLK